VRIIIERLTKSTIRNYIYDYTHRFIFTILLDITLDILDSKTLDKLFYF